MIRWWPWRAKRPRRQAPVPVVRARVISLFEWAKSVRDRRRHYHAGLRLDATGLPASVRRRAAQAVRCHLRRGADPVVGDLDRLWCQHRGEFVRIGLTGPVLVVLNSWYEGWTAVRPPV